VGLGETQSVRVSANATEEELSEMINTAAVIDIR